MSRLRHGITKRLMGQLRKAGASPPAGEALYEWAIDCLDKLTKGSWSVRKDGALWCCESNREIGYNARGETLGAYCAKTMIEAMCYVCLDLLRREGGRKG